MSVILQERLEAVKGIPLSVGQHSAPAEGEAPCGFCAAEKWSWLRGLRWSDHPQDGTSRVLWSFVRAFQDNTDQATRDAIDVWMVENAQRIAATAHDEHEQARGLLAADWVTRTVLPLWLDVAGATDAAAQLRARPVVDSRKEAAAMRDEINELRGSLKYPSWYELRADLRKRVREAVRKALDEKKGAAGAAWAAGAAEAAEAAEARKFGQLVREKFLDLWGERFEPTTSTIRGGAIELLDRMVSIGEQAS